MRGPTHALAGAYSIALFLPLQIPHHYPLLVLSAVAGFSALLPDLDNSESTVENIQIEGVKPFKIPAFVIDKMFKHRGFLHSLLALILIGFCLLAFLSGIPLELVIAILVGYLSHLVTDSLTPEGVPWLYPLDLRITFLPKFLCIRTGSFVESIFFIGLVVLYIIFLGQANYIPHSLLP